MMINKLLRKNTSPARIAGFVLSNLIGLTIMGVGLQFYLDACPVWNQKDSFLKTEYIAVNKIIDASHTLGEASADFTPEEIADLEAQPWVEKVGAFSRADFKVYASLGLDAPAGVAADDSVRSGRSISTAMFFEAVPEEFLDVEDGNFKWDPESGEVPIIISKDYLALYNFGFAGAAGLPRMSETLFSGLPLRLTLVSADGRSRRHLHGRVAGYSNRFNTILVPQAFIDSMNSASRAPSRLIIDVSSPGDSAIAEYLNGKGWEQAGDNSASSAAFMLRTVSGIVIAIGSIITLLSLFILVLSMSLLMEKNRRKIHSLLMLGFTIPDIARPYRGITLAATLTAAILAFAGVALTRSYWLAPIQGLGGGESSLLWSALLIAGLTAAIICVNALCITRRIREAWRD